MAGVTLERAQEARARWFETTFEAFRVPTYRVVWLGTILAFLAFNISMTAQGVVAYDLTGSNRAVGSVLFGQGVAMLFLNPFGGAIADRFSKRLLLFIAQGMMFIVALVTAVLILTDSISVLFLAIGAFTVGSMFSFLGPTRFALLGEFIAQERMGNAMALIQVGGNFTRISGPFLAGAMLAWPAIGPAWTYLFIAGVFVFVIATIFKIPSVPVRRAEKTSVLHDVRLGFKHITDNPRLLHAVLSFHLVTVLGMSHIVLLPGFAKDVLDAGTTGLGFLLGVAAMGGLIASLIVAGLADSPRAPLLLSLASFAFGVALIITGFAPTFALALVCMVFVGFSASAFQTLNNVVALRYTNHEFFGRVVGLMFLAWGLNSLFTLPMGYLADVLGERAVLTGSGAVLCAIVVLLALWGKRIESREAEPATAGAASL
jgi:MFS family permease